MKIIGAFDNDETLGSLQRISYLRNLIILNEHCTTKRKNNTCIYHRKSDTEADPKFFLDILDKGAARPNLDNFFLELLILKKEGLIDSLIVITQAKSEGCLRGYNNFINIMWSEYFKYKQPSKINLLNENGLIFDKVFDGVRIKNVKNLYPHDKTFIVDDICYWEKKHFHHNLCTEYEVNTRKVNADLICNVPEYLYDFPQKYIPKKYNTKFNEDYMNYPYNPNVNNLNDNILLTTILPKIKTFCFKNFTNNIIDNIIDKKIN